MMSMFNKHDQFIMNFIILPQIYYCICTGQWDIRSEIYTKYHIQIMPLFVYTKYYLRNLCNAICLFCHTYLIGFIKHVIFNNFCETCFWKGIEVIKVSQILKLQKQITTSTAANQCSLPVLQCCNLCWLHNHGNDYGHRLLVIHEHSVSHSCVYGI